jgi:hypothetical protein
MANSAGTIHRDYRYTPDGELTTTRTGQTSRLDFAGGLRISDGSGSVRTRSIGIKSEQLKIERAYTDAKRFLGTRTDRCAVGAIGFGIIGDAAGSIAAPAGTAVGATIAYVGGTPC